MPLQTFDFPYHSIETVYPNNSFQVQFGRGYRFVSKPRGPDQVIWNLTFPGMVWYFNSLNSLNLTKNPQINLGKLEEFYKYHRLHEYFNYPHPTQGLQRVRFNTPLTIPAADPAVAKSGLVRNLRVSLIYEP